MYNNEVKTNENDLIQEIAYAIKQGKIIETNLEDDDRMKPIIEAFNDYLTRNEESKIAPYSTLKNELVAIRNELVNLQKEKDELETEQVSLVEKNVILGSENDKMTDQLTQIVKILRPSK